jgi:hypothetical protein
MSRILRPCHMIGLVLYRDEPVNLRWLNDFRTGDGQFLRTSERCDLSHLGCVIPMFDLAHVVMT